MSLTSWRRSVQLLNVVGLLLHLLLVSSACSADEKPPGKTTGPWDIEALRKPPKVTVLEEGKTLSTLTYEGEPYQGKPTRVFAYLARPEKVEGKVPAMVLVHGGGGSAFKEWAELWARRGYVALAMDLAGNGPDKKRLPDGGPAQDDATKFADVPVKDAWTYHAVADVLRAVSLLAAQPDVDASRIGVTGISWGGYLTCIVAGLDDRLKVAVPVYGCGFLDEDSVWLPTFDTMTAERRKAWTDQFDPSRYLAQARMPVLFVNGTNDFAYPMGSYQKSYRLVKDRTLCVTVNMPHGHRQGWAPVEIGLFVDQQLRGGKPLTRIESAQRDGNKVEVKFRSEVPVTSAALHYTTDGGPWPKRKWQTREVKVDGTTVRAELPEGRPLVYFLTLTDERKATVSTEHEVLPAPDKPEPRKRLREETPRGRREKLSLGTLFLPEGLNTEGPVPLFVHFHAPAWIPEVAASRNRTAVLSVTLGQGSSAYAKPFADPKVFHDLLKEAEAKGGVKFGFVGLTAWSAGYGAVRAILQDQAAYERIAFVVLMDGMHASYTDKPEKGIVPEHVEVFARFAADAAAGKKQMIVTHSEIVPGSYASTTETANYLLGRLELNRDQVAREGPGKMRQLSEAKKGRFTLIGYAGATAADHVDQLHCLPEYLSWIRWDRQP